MEERPSTSRGLKHSIPDDLQEEIDKIAAKIPRVTATPEDLADNQKRWLIVGICLHSVLSPALRKYVVPILTALYEELTTKQKIDSQTYPTHLKQYQPTKAYLYYEAVNNNKAVYGTQYAKYNYKIKSFVDLSKLFLHPSMALYTGFDETCDSSALLGLIINIDKFPAVVKSKAEDVRKNIRNPWAHCYLTEWNAAKYSESFQLVDDLVQNLCLSSSEELQMKGEMEKWKTNGHNFLSGTTLGLELVSNIRQQTRALAEHAKLVANETDHYAMRIKNISENVGIILNEVTQMEKNIKRLLDKEEKHETLLDFQKVEIEFWKEQEATFVDTPVFNVITKTLESENSVLIVGEPGIGKSMLLHCAALKLQKQIGYTITPCTGIKDILQHYKENTRQMFVIDDICGRFTVSMSDIEHWVNNEDKVKRILKKGCTKVAATCRLDIYNDETFQESYTIFKSNIFNLSVEYSMENKLSICKNYLFENDIQLLKDQNVDFTPLMCYLYSKNDHFNLTDFLECPFETYQKEWNKLKSFDPYKYCSLFLCVIYNGIIKESLFDIYKENKTKDRSDLEFIFETCDIDRGTASRKIQKVLDSMVGTYVRKRRNEYRVIHDQMLDFMCSYFGNKDKMNIGILRYSHIRVFNQRTQLESLNEQHSKFTIMISKEHEKEYFERIKRDVQRRKLHHCFYNRQMKYKVYRTLFLDILKSIGDKLLIEQMFHTQKYRVNHRHAEIMECEDYSDDEENGDDMENDSFTVFMPEGPFIKTCLRGYYDILQYFISKDVDIKRRDGSYTPLTAASAEGHEQIVQLLIEKGSDVNEVDGKATAPLKAACSGGHEKIIRLLIDNGSDVNQVTSWPKLVIASCLEKMDQFKETKDNITCIRATRFINTPLKMACFNRNANIVELLIDKGSDVNQVDETTITPLSVACMIRDEKIIRLLIDKGCDVNQVNATKITPLASACLREDEKIVRLLIDKGSEITSNKDRGIYQTPLKAACYTLNASIIELLIDKGSDVNRVDDGIMLTSPLTYACLRNCEKLVQLLIDKGSDVNHIDGTGQTPLTANCYTTYERWARLAIDETFEENQVNLTSITETAARYEKFQTMVQILKRKILFRLSTDDYREERTVRIMQLLIDKGSDVNQVDGTGKTPLITACSGGYEKIVKLLLDKGSDVNQADGIGHTPLVAACTNRFLTIAGLLINKGSDVNKADDSGETPLTISCKAENEMIVQFLTYQGCDVDLVNNNGDTPLTISCKAQSEKIVQLLIDKDSDVNKVNADGETPLTISCSVENKNIVKLLIEKGSDLDKRNANGDTPLTISRMLGNEQIIQLLKANGNGVNQANDGGQKSLTSMVEKEMR